MYQDATAVRAYPIGPAIRRYPVEEERAGFWSTVNRYSIMGVLAATVLTTLFGQRGPRNLANGVLLAVNETLDTESAVLNTRFNAELTTFFAPVVAAAAAVFAVQVARQLSALQQ